MENVSSWLPPSSTSCVHSWAGTSVSGIVSPVVLVDLGARAEVEHEATVLAALVDEQHVRRVRRVTTTSLLVAVDAEVVGDERVVVAQGHLGGEVGLGGDVLGGVLIGLGLLGRVALTVVGELARRLVRLQLALALERRADPAGDEPECGDHTDHADGSGAQ